MLRINKEKLLSNEVITYVAVPMIAMGVVMVTIALTSLAPRVHQSPSKVLVLPEACKVVIQVDQDVKANVRDDVITGDTYKLIQGEDEWFNDQLKECLSY